MTKCSVCGLTMLEHPGLMSMCEALHKARYTLADEQDNNARCTEARAREVAAFEQAIAERNRDLAEKTAQHEEAWRKIEWLRVALKRQFWRAHAERTQVERLREALGYGDHWPVHDVLKKLADAAEVLLHKHDFDGHGYEEISAAITSARKINEALAATAPKETSV